jgi:hypothetical protein
MPKNEGRGMKDYDVHFVGSIPLKDARDVFETLSNQLGPHLVRIPDGETGERTHWLGWLEPIFANNPGLEPTGEASLVHATSDARPLHRVKKGLPASSIRFADLRIAEAARASYEDFAALKKAGKIPARCRFQVSIANPVSVVHRFVAEEFQEPLVTAYEQAMLTRLPRLRRQSRTINWRSSSISHSMSSSRWKRAKQTGSDERDRKCWRPTAAAPFAGVTPSRAGSNFFIIFATATMPIGTRWNPQASRCRSTSQTRCARASAAQSN